MISVLEKEITFRYLKTRKRDGFLNIISIFSFIGISLGVAVLIIVMSVMNGFRTELTNKIIGFNAHVTVDPYEKQIDSSKLSNENLKLISEDLIFSSSGEAVLLNKDFTKGIVLRGYQPKDFSKLQIIIGKKSEGDLFEFKAIGKETQNLSLDQISELINKQKEKI